MSEPKPDHEFPTEADVDKRWRQRYWLHVPSLVQHRVGVSLIDGRRARSRQSMTFEGHGT